MRKNIWLRNENLSRLDFVLAHYKGFSDFVNSKIADEFKKKKDKEGE